MADTTNFDVRRFDFEGLFDQAPGEPLSDDGPGDDRADVALKSRSRSYEQAGDLQWLMDGVEVPEPSATGTRGADDAAQEPGEKFRRVGRDIGTGVVEAPSQAVGGVRDAVQAMIDIGDLAEAMPVLGPLLKAAHDNVELPEIPEAKSLTGSAVRTVSQFMVWRG